MRSEQIRIRPELAEDMMHFHPKALLEVAQKFSRQYMDNRSETLVAQADFLIAVAAKKSSVLKGQAKGSAEHSTQTVEESVRAHGAMEEALKEGNSSQDRTPRGIEQPEDLPQGDHVDETKDTLPKSEEDIPYAGKNADDEDFGHAYFELGRAYISLVLRDHKMRFLPQAIATYRASLDHFNRFLEISGEDNPNRVRVLNNLAGAYQVQHDEMKDKQEDKKTPIDLAGLEQGIIYAREALALRAPGNTRRWESILTLGSLLGRLYVARPNQRLLDETTEIRREWLEEVPQGYEKRGPMMAEFASFIHDLDKSVFTIKLAQEAVDLMRAAFDLTPPGAEFPQYMNNLGTALDDLYQVSHDPTVADEAILIYQEALKLSPPDGMLYRSVLFNLANSYNHRWTQTKDLASLDACIKWRKALLANAPDHPDRGRIYQSLGAAHGNRFHKLHTLEDLEEGLRFFREALFVRDDKEERVETLFEISILLKDHYSLTNQPTSLDSSMRFLEEVLQARKPPHVAFCTVSNLFAEVLMIDAEKAGHDESRTRAIEICVRAVPHMQDTDVKRAHAILSLLGDALVKDYLVTRRLGALDEAIFTLRRLATMEGKKDGHVLRDLISALRLRVEETDDPADADAINRYSILLRETWKNSDDNGATIGDRHVVSLLYRAGKNANLDSEERQAILNSAKHYLERTPHGHRLHYLACVQYAMLLLDRQLGSYDFLQATKLITDAADAPVDSHRPAFEIIVPILEGIDAHLDEAEEKHDPGVDMIAWREAVLDAYIATIRLVPKVVYFGLDQRDQLPATQRARLIAVAAASHALALGKSRLSVELLEQGRAIFWNQALRLRAQDPDFIGVPSPIAVELKTILAELDALTHSPDEWIDQLTWPTWTRDSVAKARRQSVRAQQLIEEVRTRPGLERFLLGPSYDTMSTLAAEGHIIVLLLMHLHGSSQLPTAEAIVIAAPHQDPVRVFLPHVTYEKLSALSHELQKSNNEYRSGVAAEMEASRGLKVAHMPVPTETANVLQKLWMVIVKPIVDRLHLEVWPHLLWSGTWLTISIDVETGRQKPPPPTLVPNWSVHVRTCSCSKNQVRIVLRLLCLVVHAHSQCTGRS
jgi:tetratricopeptide (TPR) repeat protein